MRNIESAFSGDSIAPDKIRRRIFSALDTPHGTQFWFGFNKHHNTVDRQKKLNKKRATEIMDIVDKSNDTDEINAQISKYAMTIPYDQQQNVENEISQIFQDRYDSAKADESAQRVYRALTSPLRLILSLKDGEINPARYMANLVLPGITNVKFTGYSTENGEFDNGGYAKIRTIKPPDKKKLMQLGIAEKEAAQMAKEMAWEVSDLCARGRDFDQQYNRKIKRVFHRHGYSDIE